MYDSSASHDDLSWLRREQLSRRAFLRNIGLGLMVTLPLAGCQPGVNPTGPAGEAAAPAAAATELVFWHQLPEEQHGELRTLLDQLLGEAEPIQVEAVMLPAGESMRQRLLIGKEAGVLPDLVLLTPVPDGADLYMREILAPLNDWLGDTFTLDDFLDNVLQANTASRADKLPYTGELFGIPLDVWPVAALLNKEHAEAAGLDPSDPPQTGDALIEWAKMLTTTESGEARFGFILGNEGWQPSLVFSILGAQWQGVVDDAETPAAQWVRAALYEHQISRLGRLEPIEEFRQRQGSILWTNTYGLYTLEREAIEQQGDAYFITTPVPQVGERFATAAYTDSLSLVAPQDGDEEKLRAGVRVIKLLSDELFKRLTNWSALPSRRSQIEELRARFGELNRTPALWEPFITSLETMGHNQFVWPLVTADPFVAKFNQVWLDEVAPTLEATEAIRQWNNELSGETFQVHGSIANRGLQTTGAFQSVSFSHSSLLSRLLQTDKLDLQVCCFLCWAHWCCPSCV